MCVIINILGWDVVLNEWFRYRCRTDGVLGRRKRKKILVHYVFYNIFSRYHNLDMKNGLMKKVSKLHKCPKKKYLSCG